MIASKFFTRLRKIIFLQSLKKTDNLHRWLFLAQPYCPKHGDHSRRAIGNQACNESIRVLGSNAKLIAGVNLPMLVRVLNYRDKPIKTCLEKAISGGRDGVVHFTKTGCDHNK